LIPLFYRYLTIMMIVSAVFILLMRLIGTSRESGGNLLAYSDFEGKAVSLTLYDVDNRMGLPIGIAGTISGFSLSADSRLAYASNETGSDEIYLLDTQADKPTTINITQTPTTHEVPLSWSPDGRYLAFVSDQDAKSALHIWDGETAVDVTPEDMHNKPVAYQTTWSDDGKLAFTVRFGFDVYQISEIYLWDGETTRSLSQNPTGEDHAPVWNRDGHVAFLSARAGKFNIFTWDGQSLKDGSPDIHPIMDNPSGLIGYASFPGWTPDGHLTFASQTAADTHTQIYVWDGQTATNISQNPTLHNGSAQWSNDGRWAFMTLFSPQQLLYVRDSDNRALLTVEAYQPAWSSNGYLLFCVPNRSGWGLSAWNGSEIISIAPAYVINAHWGNSSGADCSSGQARF
jgi:Tol biopolymer transport system component